MGKRGPQPRGEAEKKGAPVGVRFPPELRERLEREAAKSGQSLSQEITDRLERSLSPELLNSQQCGSPQTFSLALLLMKAVDHAETITGNRWHKNRFTFDQVETAIPRILSAFRPAGPPDPPEEFPDNLPFSDADMKQRFAAHYLQKGVGALVAENILDNVEFTPRDPRERAKLAKDFPHVVVAAKHLKQHLRRPK